MPIFFKTRSLHNLNADMPIHRQEVYNELKNSRISAVHIQMILQWNSDEKTTVIFYILQKLREKGFKITNKFQINEGHTQMQEIVNDLKTGNEHQYLFHKTLNTEEDPDQVNIIFIKLVQNIQNCNRR